MSKTYGDNNNLPGVKVHLESGDVSPAPKLPDLSERELRLCLICIQSTRAIWIENGMLQFDLTDACDALSCYGYSTYESRPMLQEALQELGRRVEPKDL